jgi:SAM-dependent methyltransferase
MFAALKRRRARLDQWLTDRKLAHTFSLPLYQLHAHTLSLVEAYASGRCLDAGSGRSPWRPYLDAQGLEVFSLDVEERSGETDIVADLQDMPEVLDASFGTVLCTQVLEHLPRPWDALAEIGRVLEPDGYLILSVPHLSMLHEVPHDYYRYTRYGITSLLEGQGFKVQQISESGGLVSFNSHLFSMGLMTTLGSLPGLTRLIWGLNYIVFIKGAGLVDRIFGLRTIYPCNYVVLAQKVGADKAKLATLR